MHKKALVVIDIQNDITKHYRDIIDDLNAAIDWAVEREMDVVEIVDDVPIVLCDVVLYVDHDKRLFMHCLSPRMS